MKNFHFFLKYHILRQDFVLFHATYVASFNTRIDLRNVVRNLQIYDPLSYPEMLDIHLLQMFSRLSFSKMVHTKTCSLKLDAGMFNPFMPIVFSLHYQLEEFISNFRVVGLYCSFLFNF